MAELKSLIVNGVTRLNNTGYAKNLYADKFITNGGTSSQYVRGDGTLAALSDLYNVHNHDGRYIRWAGSAANVSAMGWGTLTEANGYTILTHAASSDGGDWGMVNKGGQIFMQLDGYYYQNEGRYRVVDTYDLESYYTKTQSDNKYWYDNGNLYQNNSYNANTLKVGGYIFRSSGYGNTGSGSAHANVLNENSTIEVFANLQLSTVAWSDTINYRVKWGSETSAGRPNAWSAWNTLLSNTNYTDYVYSKTDSDNRYVNVTGDTMTGTLIFNGVTSSNWTEGIRINNASNGWTSLTMGGTKTSGTNSSIWSFHTYEGNFYLAKNGSSSFTTGLQNVSGAWMMKSTGIETLELKSNSSHTGLVINSNSGSNPFTRFKVNGTCYAEHGYSTGKGTYYIGPYNSDDGIINVHIANKRIGIGTYSPEKTLDVNGIAQIYQRGLDNTAFKNLFLIKQQNNTEPSGDNWGDSNPSFGIGFNRYWTSNGNPYGETTCAGIYATVSSSWRGGLVFRTKNNQTQSGTHDVTALRLAPSGKAYFASDVYSYGYHHLSQDSNDYVLLAGGSYRYLNDITWYSWIADLSSLTNTNYYPVLVNNIPYFRRIKIKVNGTYAANFSERSDGKCYIWFTEEISGSSWSGNNGLSRIIHGHEEWGGNGKGILVKVTQLTNSSKEVFWLRGGAKYEISSDYYGLSLTYGETSYEYNSQTASYIEGLQNKIRLTETNDSYQGAVTGAKVWYASKAYQLETARNLKVNLASSSAQSFNGTADATSIGVSGTLPAANLPALYWANLSVQTSQNYGTIPTVKYLNFKKNSDNNAAGWIGTGSSSNDNIGLYAYAGNILTLGANGSEGIRLDASLRVGIGTTSPSYKLHVAGNAMFSLGGNLSPSSGSSFSQGYSFNIVKSTSELYGLHICVEGSGNVIAQSSAMSAAYYNLSLNPLGGNVGVGTSSPSYKLHVAGTGYISGETWLNTSIYIIAEPGISLLKSTYGLPSNYTSNYNTENYLKAWSKYAYAKAAGRSVIGYCSPSSRGFIQADIYSNGLVTQAWKDANTSYPNAEIGLPIHITGRYYPHGGGEIIFGTSYGTWYYRTALDTSNYSSYLGYIATTPVQSSSAAQAVTGITALTFNGSTSAGNNYITGAAGRINFGGNFHIDSSGNNSTYINYYTANNIYMVSGTNQGKVGIGNNSPVEKLHVTGNIGITSASSGNTIIGHDLDALIIGPKTQRSGTANSYYPGIAFNHMFRYSNATYDNAAQGWIGLRLHSTPGSELSYLVFATKPGTGASNAGNDRPLERMCIAPDGKIGIGTIAPYSNFEVAFTGNADPDGTSIKDSAKFALNRHNNDGLFMGIGASSTFWMQSAYYGKSDVTSATHTYKLSLNPLGGNVGIGVLQPLYKLHVDGSTYLNGVMYTNHSPGSWVSGMSTNPRIWYNKGNNLSDTGSYNAFWAMKDHPGNVINFGGLNNCIGFYGYYAGRTANDYDWNFTVDMTTGVWTSTKNIGAAGFVKSGSSSSYVLLGDGGHKAISDFAVSTQRIFRINSIDYYLYSPYSTTVNLDDVYVNVSGDTMTGMLTIKNNSWNNILTLNRTSASGTWGPAIIFQYDGTSNGTLTMTSNQLYIGDNGSNRYKAWHEGNDGSGSGLDADLLDGLHAHSGRNNEANKLVRTDASGYILAGWINTTSGDMGSTAFSRIYVSNDAYIRYVSVSQFKTGLFGAQVGSTSVPIYWTGSAFSTCIVSFGDSSYGEHNANNITDNGLKYYNSNGPSTSLGASTTDGALYSQAYSTSWVAQIAQDYRNGGLFVRGKNNGTWKEWHAVLDTGHIGLVATDGKFEINPQTRTIKTIKTDSAWNAQVYSTDGYVDNVYVEFKASQTNAYIMVGLNSDPTADANYSSLDYCWYIQSGASLNIYENGSSISSITGHTSYAVGDEFRIEFSGGYVRYYHNGVICRVVAREIGSKLYFDTSFHNAGAIYDVKFGPIGASNILFFNRNTDMPNQNTVNTESYIATVGITGQAPTTLTKPSGMDNAFGIIHMHLHTGNYSMQLGFGGKTGHMYFRNAYNSSSFGSWTTILDSNNSSVSKSGQTLSVKINGTTLSLTNTDSKVLQSQTSTSSYRPLILGFASNATYNSASLYAQSTEQVYSQNTITARPDVGILYVAKNITIGARNPNDSSNYSLWAIAGLRASTGLFYYNMSCATNGNTNPSNAGIEIREYGRYLDDTSHAPHTIMYAPRIGLTWSNRYWANIALYDNVIRFINADGSEYYPIQCSKAITPLIEYADNEYDKYRIKWFNASSPCTTLTGATIPGGRIEDDEEYYGTLLIETHNDKSSGLAISEYNGVVAFGPGDGSYIFSVYDEEDMSKEKFGVNYNTVINTSTIITPRGCKHSQLYSYSGGGYYAVDNPNLRLIGDPSLGLSTIEFVSQKGTTSINKPSDSAFIQYNPYGVTTLSSIGSAPTIASSGEVSRLIIGVTNESTDQIWLQTPGAGGLRHIVGTNNYRILTSQNTYISGSTIYINGSSVTAGGSSISYTYSTGNITGTNYILTTTATSSSSFSVKAYSKVYYNSSGVYYTSDRKVKYNIKDILNSDVDKLFKTNNGLVRSFFWKENNKKSFGFIAQELKEYCPEAVDFNTDDNLFHVNYNVAFAKIIGAMFKKIKEQDKIIKDLEKKVNKK